MVSDQGKSNGNPAAVDFEITEFDPRLQDQTIRVIDRVLKDLAVIPDTTELIDDADLFMIPAVYHDRGRFWVALQNGQVIGTVAIREISEHTAILNRMFVLRNYHGSGIGQALLNTALQFAGEQKYQEVILNTHVLMKRAHRFYEKNSFVRYDQDAEKYHYRRNLS